MALDGLSNQNVGIYRSKDPSKTTEKLTARAKEKTELNAMSETGIIEKVDPDGKGQEENKEAQEFILSHAPQVVEQEDEPQVLQLTVENSSEPVELEYTVGFNSKTKMIEMKNAKTNEMIEAIKPEDLIKLLSKAKNVSGMFCDKKI